MSASVLHKASPRRSSFASLSKLGQKSKPSASTTTKTTPSVGPGQELSCDDLLAGSGSWHHATNHEEDGDQVESAPNSKAWRTVCLSLGPRRFGCAAVPRGTMHPTRSQSRESTMRPSKRNLKASQTSVVPIELQPPRSSHHTQCQTTPSGSSPTPSHAPATKLSDVKELADIMESDAARPLKWLVSKSKQRSCAGTSHPGR